MECQTLPIQANYRPHGYYNPRNACFINSTVQLLTSIGPLRHLLQQSIESGPFFMSLKESLNARSLVQRGTSMYTILEQFLGYPPEALHQQCAGEFLMYLLSGLDNDLQQLRRRSASQNDDQWQEVRGRQSTVVNRTIGVSILYDIIGIRLCTEFRAQGKSFLTYQEEPMLMVPVMHSLTDAMSQALRQQRIEQFQLDGKQVRCSSQAFVDNYSPFLLIQVNRFDIQNGLPVKIQGFMSFPIAFSIPQQFVMPSRKLLVQQKQAKPPCYELQGFIVHHGTTANSGHYTSVLKSGQGWVHIDDNIVRPIGEARLQDFEVYILLYKQKNAEFI